LEVVLRNDSIYSFDLLTAFTLEGPYRGGVASRLFTFQLGYGGYAEQFHYSDPDFNYSPSVGLGYPDELRSGQSMKVSVKRFYHYLTYYSPQSVKVDLVVLQTRIPPLIRSVGLVALYVITWIAVPVLTLVKIRHDSRANTFILSCVCTLYTSILLISIYLTRTYCDVSEGGLGCREGGCISCPAWVRDWHLPGFLSFFACLGAFALLLGWLTREPHCSKCEEHKNQGHNFCQRCGGQINLQSTRTDTTHNYCGLCGERREKCKCSTGVRSLSSADSRIR
jgi:hypothetical protein